MKVFVEMTDSEYENYKKLINGNLNIVDYLNKYGRRAEKTKTYRDDLSMSTRVVDVFKENDVTITVEYNGGCF